MAPKSNSRRGGPPANSKDDDGEIREGVPILTKYEFAPVAVPDDFLTTAPPDAAPITYEAVDWVNSPLPGNDGKYAVVLDNVLSPSECEALLQLVEQSVPASNRGLSGTRFWTPALVNVGGGFEVLSTNYRNSDRIIWDEQTIVDRLWERCKAVPEVWDRLAKIENEGNVHPRSRPSKGEKGDQGWEFRRFNKRMRFLKYGPGQFFRRKTSPTCTQANLNDNC
jgi:hypothetical protein